MELAKIEKLLDAYFDGETTLHEEKILRAYFVNENVATHLLQYKPIFLGLEAAAEERLDKEFAIPKTNIKKQKNWMYLAVAVLIVAFLAGGIYTSVPKYSTEEKEALAAFEKSKKAMMLLSQNLNKGTEQLTLVNQFNEVKSRVFE